MSAGTAGKLEHCGCQATLSTAYRPPSH